MYQNFFLLRITSHSIFAFSSVLLNFALILLILYFPVIDKMWSGFMRKITREHSEYFAVFPTFPCNVQWGLMCLLQLRDANKVFKTRKLGPRSSLK